MRIKKKLKNLYKKYKIWNKKIISLKNKWFKLNNSKSNCKMINKK